MKHVALFLSLMLFVGAAVSTQAQILVNEILADPVTDWNGDGSVNSRTDEWVEIINAGTVVVDLSEYRLGDESGAYAWRYGFSGSIAPGEILIVYGSDAVAWQAATGYPAYGLSLNNAGDTVYLYKAGAADTMIADSYAYASFAVLDDRSVGRNPDGAGTWAIFDGLNPYSGDTPPLGTGCNPSPGYANGCVTPVEGSTWGVIKSEYSN